MSYAAVYVDTDLHFVDEKMKTKDADKNRKFFYGKSSDARKLSNIADITILELQRSREEGRGIDQIDKRMNKYVAEALIQSFNNRVGYEIKAFVQVIN